MLKQLPLDERWNVYTHAFGALMSIFGISWVFFTIDTLDSFAKISLLVYGFSMIFLFSASAKYHSVLGEQQVFWQKIDHIGIFFLIAGTYTPVTLTVLYATSGLYLFAGVWSIALFGVVYKLFLIGRFKNFSLFLYLAMGWLAVIDFRNIMELFPSTALVYLVLGGFFYTVGTLFYRWESIYFHHVIWHVFVLCGAAAHFMMVIHLLV